MTTTHTYEQFRYLVKLITGYFRWSYDDERSPLKRDLLESEEWCTGGITGGSCWGGEADTAIDADPPVVFHELNRVLDLLFPELTYRQFTNEVQDLIRTDERTNNDYYGNYTRYTKYIVSIGDLYRIHSGPCRKAGLLLLVAGLPGAGKTTLARKLTDESNIYDDPKQPPSPEEISAKLALGHTVVIADPHFTSETARTAANWLYRDLHREWVFFSNEPNVCRVNARERADGRNVDESITKMAKKYEVPDFDVHIHHACYQKRG